MKRQVIASALALSALWFAAPACASTPAPLPKAAASFDSGSLHVDVYGTPGKRALVFIPGLTCGPWEWSGEINRFASNYTIYAITLPGFDGSAPISGPLFHTTSADFWSLLENHRIDRPVVIGHSLGGTLAIMLAEQHADRLRAIVAVDGLPVFPGMENATPQQRAQAAQRFGSMMASSTTAAQFEYAEKNYALPTMMSSPQDIAAVAPLVAKSDPKASGAWASEDVSLDLRPQLKAVSVPFLEVAPYDPVLQAQAFNSAAAVAAYYSGLLSGAPSAHVKVIEPSRHFVMYDRPDDLHAAIAQFVDAQ